MIGVPHSSFDMLANLSGGTARMVAQFVQGLERFRTGNWTPPKIISNPMTASKIQVAKAMNALCGERPFKEIFELEQEMEESQTEFVDILEMIDVVPDTNATCASAVSPAG